MNAQTMEGAVCPVCRVGHLRKGTKTSMLERDDAVVVVKDVPGWICDSCGEAYTRAETTDHVLRLANEAFERGAEVEVIRYRSPQKTTPVDV